MSVREPSIPLPGAQSFRPRPFRPAWWLPGPHAQTVAGRYLRAGWGVRYLRERIATPDDDFLDLDFARVSGVPGPDPSAPVVLVVHGLEGSSRSSYVLATCRAVAREGMRPVVLNFRSCGGEPNRTPRFYHAGETGDLAFALQHVARCFPGAPLAAVGYSLGGNVLLKFLAERGDAAPVVAAAAVSVPFDLSAGADKLERSRMGRLYTAIFVRSLRRKYRRKLPLIGDRCDPARVLSARSFREFDAAATARLHGFRDAEHYYAASSSGPRLGAIRVPTLVLHAIDDPFVAEDRIPHEALRENPWLEPLVLPRGGHVGFIEGNAPWRPRFWAEVEVARYLSARVPSAAAVTPAERVEP